jgi:hypothetical protein
MMAAKPSTLVGQIATKNTRQNIGMTRSKTSERSNILSGGTMTGAHQ